MMVEKTKSYAIQKHKEANHKYGNLDYSYHLQMVHDVAKKFIHLIEKEEQDNVLAACWVHDIIEDARETYNDVKKQTNTTIAELAYALTNEKGKNRAERANDKYYQGIRSTKNAAFIKFCDRIANIQHSKSTGSRMFELYKEENKSFISRIYNEDCEEIANYLNSFFKT